MSIRVAKGSNVIYRVAAAAVAITMASEVACALDIVVDVDAMICGRNVVEEGWDAVSVGKVGFCFKGATLCLLFHLDGKRKRERKRCLRV